MKEWVIVNGDRVICFGERVQALNKTSVMAAYVPRQANAQVLGLRWVPTCLHKTARCSRELSSPCLIPGSVLNG